MNTFTEKGANIFPKIRFLDIYMVGHKGYIAGGCFKNIFANERIKDLDVFFETEKDFIEAELYFKKLEGHSFVYENAKVIAFKNEKTGIRIELVRSNFGSPEEILSMFDFSITKFAYIKKVTPPTEDNMFEETTEFKAFFHVDFFEHLQCKKLVLEPEIEYPISTWERSYKYRDYGFKLCRESKENLLTALRTADIDEMSNIWYEAGMD